MDITGQKLMPASSDDQHGQKQRMCNACGFTLVELMVTLAVAAILATIAIPSFRHTIASNQLNTVTNAFAETLDNARSEAIKRNKNVLVCGTTGNSAVKAGGTLGKACDSTHPGNVYTLDNSNNNQQILAAPDIHANIEVNFQGIIFNPEGQGRKSNDADSRDFDVASLCHAHLAKGRKISIQAGSHIDTSEDYDCQQP